MVAFAKRFAVAAILGLVSLPCMAGDEALYGDQPSKDAVFVRFVNATDASLSIESNLLPPVALRATAEDRIGSFASIDRRPAPPLVITASAGDTQGHETIELKAGTRVNIVVKREGKALTIKAFASPLDSNTGRTLLSFTNAATECGATSLKLEPAGATIFADVQADSERSRKINPVNARLSVACGSHGTAIAELQRAEPGGVLSVWLLTPEGRPTLVVHADSLPGWHP